MLSDRIHSNIDYLDYDGLLRLMITHGHEEPIEHQNKS